MSLREASRRAAILKALADEIAKAIKTNKVTLKDAMDADDIDTLGSVLDDGTRVARVSRAGGGTAPEVTDPVKFAAWVEANRPDEIVTVKTVRESYQNAVLADVATTGEAVPGVKFVTATPYLTVNYEKGGIVSGQELIRQAWQSGQISLTEMLALPAGGDVDG